MEEIKFECKTCKNPYCSRTLEERQNKEVEHHFQYAWECTDKEKYVQSDGGYLLIEKEAINKYLFTVNKMVDFAGYVLYYAINPDSKMCVPNAAYIKAKKMFEDWRKENEQKPY